MPTVKRHSAAITLREAAQILGCTYERARQLAKAKTILAKGDRLLRSTVLAVAYERAKKEADRATQRHAEALEELYAANRELARVRGMMS